MSFRQHVKVPTYSTNRGLSKNAIKKVVILIGSKDMLFAKISDKPVRCDVLFEVKVEVEVEEVGMHVYT